MTNKEYVRDIAITLSQSSNTMTGNQLVDSLNAQGFRTTFHTAYKNNSRGIYKLIHATYDWLVNQGQQKLADIVANSFTNQYGEPAWDK